MRRFGSWAWVVICAVAGCIDAESARCGDYVCASGSVCTPGGCALPADVAACDGAVDGATCTAANGGTGTCQRTACRTGLCGNGQLNAGEACDDGNQVSGDGCRDDCQKIEVCGDGVLDMGERCDDNNDNPADRCDACGLTRWDATALIGGNTSALTVGLGSPSAVAIDRDHNIYIGEAGKVRRVDAAGVVTVFAGGVIACSLMPNCGDEGPATSAAVFGHSVATDGLGRVYIADPINQRIRRVDTKGIITTVAGTGVFGFSGDGGAAATAQVNSPFGVLVDGFGAIYIADTNNHRIRRVDANGTITTVAGTGIAGLAGDGLAATAAQVRLNAPHGLALDDAGNLYFADRNNHRIRRIAANGIITTVVGTVQGFAGDNGPATAAQLDQPKGLAVDANGNLYIADSGNSRIRRVDATGTITTIAGNGLPGFGGDNGPAVDASLQFPSGVGLDSAGTLYIADRSNYRVRRVDTSGIISTIAGSGSHDDIDGSVATSARLQSITAVSTDGPGRLYIVETTNTIRRVGLNGVIETIAGTGNAGFTGDGGDAMKATFQSPAGATVDSAGNLYIADTLNNRVRRVDTTGIITTIVGDGVAGFFGDDDLATIASLNHPTGVAVDADGTLYIADRDNHRIRRVDAGTGIITTVAGIGVPGFSGDGDAAATAQLTTPKGIALDGAGNLFIADTGNHVIRRVDRTSGEIATVAGTGGVGGDSGDGLPAIAAQLRLPIGVGVDSVGTLSIADSGNASVRRVDADGFITTVVGQGCQFNGDGGQATNAQICGVGAVAVDGFGNLYISESMRVRRVNAMGVITTAAGPVDPEHMGPFATARLADPTALVHAAEFTIVAGGNSGTVQVARRSSEWLEAAVGRYWHVLATGNLARFRESAFTTVGGVAYDAGAKLLYLTERNGLHVVTVADPADKMTWTIARFANSAMVAGFADGAIASARFRAPTGLYLDETAHQLYVADTGNHVVRAIDLASATARTVAGTPQTLGFFGDGTHAESALLFAPRAITRCANGDFFIADTGNHRVRRIAAGTHTISTVLGDGVAASSGEGAPASSFPVDTPLGLACDTYGNLFVSSTTSIRMLAANAVGVVDGSGEVQTIYGLDRDTFPASVTRCLTGLVVIDATTLQVTDGCTGILIELHRRVP